MANCPKCHSPVKESSFNGFTGYSSYRCTNKSCEALLDKKDLIINEKFVYHVANPTIPGRVVAINDKNSKLVEFLSPVSFSGNPGRSEKEWICSNNLLYSSPEEAKKNNDSRYSES